MNNTVNYIMDKTRKLDISIVAKKYDKAHNFTPSKLELQFDGQDMNHIIVNTLRRVSFDDIPMYAFAYINIEHNNSVFNNDMMKIRLNQLPIYNIDSDMYFLHPSYWENVDYDNKNRLKHDKEIPIEGIINVYNNNKDEILNVTTDNITYYVNNEKQERYPCIGEPILIIQLKPNETFKCQMKGCLGVGERNNIWSAAAQSYYDYDDDKPNKINFTIESCGQNAEHTILIKACKLIKMKLNGIKQEIKNRVDAKEITHSQSIMFEIVKEDHTMGNLINNALQDHNDIIFSGLSKPNHLVRTIVFKIESVSEKISPIKPFFESIEYLINVFDEIERQINIIKKKHNIVDAFDKNNKDNKNSVENELSMLENPENIHNQMNDRENDQENDDKTKMKSKNVKKTVVKGIKK